MFRNILFTLFISSFIISLFAQDDRSEASVQVMLPEVQDMELLSNWSTGNRPFNDVWGYVDSDGDEVAIIGSRSHYYFVDISDPTEPELIDGYQGGSVSIWRDMKTYGQWAYGVCDACSEGLSIFKLGDSPKDNGVQFVQQNTSYFGSAHNIFIDEEHGRLYAIGTNTQRNGVIILDIKTNPEAPILLAAVDVPGGYMHDLYVRDNIGYGNSESRGLFVYNFSTPSNPQFLGSMTSYLQQGYNHSGWLNPAGDVLIMADETHNTSLKAVDVSDLSDIEVTSLFRSELLAPAATGSIAHNPFVRDNYAVVSYYHDGVQIFDISDPANVQQVAWYDTFLGNTNYSGFSGCWGAYPFLPSGNILGSDGTNGLFVLNPTQITFNPIAPIQPPFAFINEDVNPCIPNDTPVSLSLTTDAHTIQWYRNGNLVGFNTSYTATSEGTYTAIVYKGPHSLTLDPVEIVYGEMPDVTTNIGDEPAISLCAGESIEIIVDAGADSYQWFLDGNIVSDQGNSLTANEEGMYTVTATLGACEATSIPVGIVNGQPEAILNQTEDIVLCEGESTTLSTDSEGDTYEWYKGFNDPILVGSGQELLVDELGFYRVEVSNGACTTSSENIAVESVEVPEVVFDTSENFTFCDGETFTLTVLTSGIEYIFTLPNGNPLASGPDNFVEINESTQVDVTVMTEFCTSNATVDIFQAQSPVSVINADGDQVICNGESKTLISQNMYDSYQWFFDGVPITGATESTYFANQSGNYTLEVTNTFDCFDRSDAYTLEVVDIPVIEFIESPSINACEGELVTLQIVGEAERYAWTDSEGNSIPGDNLSQTTANGIVTVEAFNGNCASQILEFFIDRFSPPVLDVIPTEETICTGESSTLQASTNSFDGDFIWIRNGETIAQNQTELFIDQPGVYSIQTLGGVCFASSPDYVINLGQQPNTIISTPFTSEFCEGDVYTLEVEAGQASYTWLRDGAPLNNETNNSLVVNSTGIYSVQITSADGCFGQSNEYTFTFYQLPDATIQTDSEQSICEGNSIILESPQSADTYTWFLNGEVISTEANFQATTAGIYQLELISNNCSSRSQEINITVDSNPIVDLNANLFGASFCNGESIDTDINQDFDSYLWYKDNDPFSTDQNISISESGIYYLEVLQNNCPGSSEPFTVTVYAIPDVNIDVQGSTQLCAGDFTTLVAGGDTDTQITWSKNGLSLGITENILVVTETGLYTFQAERNGCQNISEEVSVDVANNPEAEIAGESIRDLCADESIILESLSNADSYTWFLDGIALAESNEVIEITQAGEYTLMTSLGNCITVSEPIQINLVEVPELDPDLFKDYILCEGETFTLDINIQQGEITMYRDDVLISTGETTFNLTTPGVYYFDYQIRDCIKRSAELTVALAMLPSLDELPTATSLCAGEEYTFDAPAGFDSYIWTKDGEVITSAMTNQLLVDQVGTYTLTIEQDGCTAKSEDLEVEIITLPSIEIFPSVTNTCGDGEVILSLDALDFDSIFLALDGEIISSDQEEVIITDSGIYTLIGKTGDCTTESNLLEFIFSDNPVITSSAGEVFACPSDITNLSVTGQDDYIYSWTAPDGVLIGTEMFVDVIFPGIYLVQATDPATGCISSTSITLTHYEVTVPIITVDANVLTSTEADVYQWYLDGQVITDAFDRAYTATVSGTYQVATLDMNDCIVFSEPALITVSSTQTITEILSANLFPNPTSDRLALTLTTAASLDLEITVFNQLGQSLWTISVQQQGEQIYPIPVRDMTAGLYYLRVQNAQGHQQTYKFIKQ